MSENKANYDPNSLPDLLPIYYKRLFPYGPYFKWLNYGGVPKTYFTHREFSFTLKDDVYLRYQSFSDQQELEKEVQKRCPYKIDIGAVFSHRPKDQKTVKASSFQAQEKELVFDIDMTDYDDVRYCCSGADICKKCWPLMTIAIRIIDRALSEDFGFEHRLWVYSGRRGVHCWVCDESARKLSQKARSAISEYLSVVKGGENQIKKVSLFDGLLHPSVQQAVNITEKYFKEYALKRQDFLGDDERMEKVMQLIGEGDIAAQIEMDMKQICKAEGKSALEVTSANKWAIIKRAIEALAGKKQKRLVEEIMLQYCYPRLDVNVSKGVNHLLKSPFCVHPKTGKVCVPIDVDNVEDFDPFAVPLISQICDELNLIEKTEDEKKRVKDYRKTSLSKSMEVFDRFLKNMENSWKGKLREQSGLSGLLSANQTEVFECCNSSLEKDRKQECLGQLLTQRIYRCKELLYLLDKIQGQDPELKVTSGYSDQYEGSVQQLHVLHYEKQKCVDWEQDQKIFDEVTLLKNFTKQLVHVWFIELAELESLLQQLTEALHIVVIKELQERQRTLNPGLNLIHTYEEEDGEMGGSYKMEKAHEKTTAVDVMLEEMDESVAEDEMDESLYLSLYSYRGMGSGASAKQQPSPQKRGENPNPYNHGQPPPPPPPPPPPLPPQHNQHLPPGNQHPLGMPRNDGSYQFQHSPSGGGLPYPAQDHESFPQPEIPEKRGKKKKKKPKEPEPEPEPNEEEDEITKGINAQGWSYEKDRIYMMVLSAEEFLGRMQETDERIRTISQACERELHRKTIEELLGLRGHLQDELLRIEQMLAKDDPKLRNLNSFENNFPHVVAKLRELLRKEGIVKAKVIQEELPPSSEGTGSGQTGSQTTGSSSASAGTQSGAGGGVSVGVQNSAASTEEDLKQRHKEEEKKVAENYADRFVKKTELSPDDVERLLQDHALSMQALRNRQSGERESMKERMRSKLRDKLQRDKYNGDKAGTSGEPSSSGQATKKKVVEFSEKPEQVVPPSSMYGNYEDEDSDDSDTGGVLAETMWNKMNLQRRMTAEHMQDMVKTFQADVNGSEPLKPPSSLDPKGMTASGDEQDAETTREDQDFVDKLIRKNRAEMSDEDFAAFMDSYLHDRDSLRRYKAQRKAELDDKLKRKLKGKKKRHSFEKSEGFDSSDDGGYSDDFEEESQKSENGSVTGSQEDLDEETLEELRELKADLQYQMGSNRRDLTEDDVRRMLALYRKKQAEIIAAQRATRDKHQDKMQEKLRDKMNQKQAADPNLSSDDQFFQKLMMRQQSGELSKEEFGDMLKEYMGKKKEAERQRRRELRKRDTEVDKTAASELVDNFLKDKEELNNVRKAERNKIDEKLKRRLMSKKKKQEMAGQDSSERSEQSPERSQHSPSGESVSSNDSSHRNNYS